MSAARFYLKVYDRLGATLRQTIDSKKVLSSPRIVREVGKPASDVTFELALPWDGNGLGNATGINYADLVLVYAANDANPSGVLVYTGIVTDVRGLFTRVDNRTFLRLFPVEAMLGNALYNAGSFAVSFAAKTAAFILGAAIDDMNSVQGATFLTKNLGSDGLSITSTYSLKTHLDVALAAAKFLDSTWYLRFRPNGQVDMQQWADVTPTHRLTAEHDVESIDVTGSIIDLKNDVIMSWGSVPTKAEYQDVPGQSIYGRRAVVVTDPTVTNGASSDLAGNAKLGNSNDPVAKSILTVNSSYPIETILPGDTCIVRNVTAGGAAFVGTGVARIVRTEYDGRTARLSLGDVVENFGAELGAAIKANS